MQAAKTATGIRVIDDSLMSRLKDKNLVRTAGLVGGKWRGVEGGRETFEVRNPATNQVIATLPKLSGSDTKEAIAAAHGVFPKWSNMTAKERGAILRKWHQEIIANKDDIATIITMECGKPTAEAMSEIEAGAASVEWFAEQARRITGDTIEPISRDLRMVTIKQPVGVVGAITPWNFPMGMITRKVAPALAAGCTVVLKPAEATPLSAVALAELADRAGLPEGVFNIVMGDAPAIGDELVASKLVRKLGFTGSTKVGKQLAAGAADTVKRVSLELGGHAPFIVFDDADLDKAADGALMSGLRNAGQTCVCANRIFVHDSIYDKFASIIVDKVSKLQTGDGLDKNTTTGPLIRPDAVERVVAQVDDAKKKGGKILIGGDKPQLQAPYDAGNFYEPTVIGDCTSDMRCFAEETFGPLLPLTRFSSDEEVIKMANDTDYGLAGYFFTKNLARAWRIAEQLEYGLIGVNEIEIETEASPFGGVKQSGVGRENGRHGLDEFLEEKYICMGLGPA